MSLFNVPWLIDDDFSESSEGTTHNITVSGGIVFGNTATTQATYSPGSSGGIVFGNTATTQATYTPTAAGGLVFGGSAEVSLGYAVSGGLLFGSTATTQATYNPGSTGGIEFGGEAPPSITPPVSGGLVFGGSAPGSLEAGVFGGIVFGSTATTQATYNPSVSGGIRFGGTGDDSIVDVEDPSGGIVFGSAAAVQATYSPAAAGGLVFGSGATAQATYSPGTLGGVVWGSSAEVSLGYVVSGGIVFGGEASVSDGATGITYDITVSGGIVFGGSAAESLSDIDQPTGGIVFGGSAAVSVSIAADEACCFDTHAHTPSGGIEFGGSATVASSAVNPTGGIVFGGSAAVSVPTQAYEDFEAVYHLKESGSGIAAEFKDSTAHAYHGQGGQGFSIRTPTRTSGRFYYANQFDGNDFINCPEFSLLDESPLTVTLWVKRENLFLNRVFYSIGQTAITPEGWQVQIGHDRHNRLTAAVQVVGSDDWQRYTVTGETILGNDCWYHVALVWNPGSGLSLYLNGELEDSQAVTATALAPATSGSYIGRVDNAAYAQAKMQEVRIAPLTRNADWLAAEYEAICGADFYTVSEEENLVYG